MKIDCKDFEKILREGENLSEAAGAHLQECPTCRKDWDLWQAIEASAPELRREWESPELWSRIRKSLDSESGKPNGWRLRWMLATQPVWRYWQPVTAVLVMFVLSGLGGWMILRKSPPASEEKELRLLTERALSDIEKAEAAYLKSIERLSQLAARRVEQPQSPLLANYREKLLLLDSAIGELRANIEQNRFNAHLRHELLSIYQEKQRTLQAVLKDEAHEN
jgi:hypothetical protein